MSSSASRHTPFDLRLTDRCEVGVGGVCGAQLLPRASHCWSRTLQSAQLAPAITSLGDCASSTMSPFLCAATPKSTTKRLPVERHDALPMAADVRHSHPRIGNAGEFTFVVARLRRTRAANAAQQFGVFAQFRGVGRAVDQHGGGGVARTRALPQALPATRHASTASASTACAPTEPRRLHDCFSWEDREPSIVETRIEDRPRSPRSWSHAQPVAPRVGAPPAAVRRRSPRYGRRPPAATACA